MYNYIKITIKHIKYYSLKSFSTLGSNYVLKLLINNLKMCQSLIRLIDWLERVLRRVGNISAT